MARLNAPPSWGLDEPVMALLVLAAEQASPRYVNLLACITVRDPIITDDKLRDHEHCHKIVCTLYALYTKMYAHCMYVCMYVRMYVRMYVCMYVCLCV